jgi:murein DD-endopeptidase MepM/ murein hydrolase activator NlpD
MKNFYLSLFIGIGLALATKNGFAKPLHSTINKQGHVSSKSYKIHTKTALIHKKKNLFRSSLPSAKTHKKNSSEIFTVNEIELRLPISIDDSLESQQRKPDEETNQQTATNNRIHSLIHIRGNNVIDNSSEQTEHHNFFSVQGVVNTSLTQAAQEAGLSNELIIQLTNIFAWDIDFATKIQNGDQFTIIYEKSDVTNGQIMAAEFVTGGKTFTAIRYKDSEGQINYYSPEGKMMRKAFLSTPVDFIRISSGFDVHRKHPILNRIRAHKGVDYAARTGTPVKAAGDGKIIFLGRKGGYGQVMILEHGEHYETLYAHLSDFKKGLQSGDQVEQGQVIGYVGQTGLATGPHLHYEFRVDGVHRNPEALNHQHTLPLSDNKLAEFKSQSRPLLAQLYKTKSNNLLAKNAITPIH